MRWTTLDTVGALTQQRQQREATTSGNAGGFAVPLGGLLRPAVVAPSAPPRRAGYQSLDAVLDAYARAARAR